MTGEAYWRDITLPGEQSGGLHVCAVLSAVSYNARTGTPVLAALRSNRPNAYRIPVARSEYRPFSGYSALDQDRVIGLDQCSGIPATEIGPQSGEVDDTVILRVKQAIPRQFQFAGPWRMRGDVHKLVAARGTVSQVVLVVNDAALGHPAQQQVLALPYDDDVLEGPLLLLGKFELGPQLLQVDQHGQSGISAILGDMFGL